jgi:hypothetical protein
MVSTSSNESNNTALTSPGQLDYRFSFLCSAPKTFNAVGDSFDYSCRIKHKYLCSPGYLGELCHGCKWAVLQWLPFTCPYCCQSPEKIKHKQGRFYVRALRGVTCGIIKGYRFRWFVLTESDEALLAGLDFGNAWNKLVTLIRYYCPDFQYCIVEHHQGAVSVVTGKQRLNRHILSYGSDKLPLALMKANWLKNYKSSVTGMEEIRHISKAVKYLAGYLGRGEKFVRSWHSQGWVFPGWVGFNRSYHRQYGEYITAEVLSSLSLLKSSAREYELEYLKNTGFDSKFYGGVESGKNNSSQA